MHLALVDAILSALPLSSSLKDCDKNHGCVARADAVLLVLQQHREHIGSGDDCPTCR